MGGCVRLPGGWQGGEQKMRSLFLVHSAQGGLSHQRLRSERNVREVERDWHLWWPRKGRGGKYGKNLQPPRQGVAGVRGAQDAKQLAQVAGVEGGGEGETAEARTTVDTAPERGSVEAGCCGARRC